MTWGEFQCMVFGHGDHLQKTTATVYLCLRCDKKVLPKHAVKAGKQQRSERFWREFLKGPDKQ